MGAKVRVAVLSGGRDGERASADSVLAHLDPARFDAVATAITPSGELDAAIVGGADVVFPVLHGPYGKGGTVQGILEMIGVPYVGSRLLASAAVRDRALVATLLGAAGIATGSGEGRAVRCGVLEFPDGDVRVSAPAELRTVEDPAADDGIDIPAKLDDAVAERVQEAALAAFRLLDCRGLAEIAFALTDAGAVVDVVTTMPSLVPASTFVRAWAVTGTDLSSLLTMLVDGAR
ncbi:hypothetical protein [Pseudonocardia sp. GCM10023141]|uniref:hypothetical protein n=1 Tax=Pseudonocardia sp. GCM10023141 TaxID=3252653 RepID=UPI003612931E